LGRYFRKELCKFQTEYNQGDRTGLEQTCGGGVALQGAIGGKWIGRDWHRDVGALQGAIRAKWFNRRHRCRCAYEF